MPAILPIIPTPLSTLSKLFFFILTVTYIKPAESPFFIDFLNQFVLSRNHKGPERLILGEAATLPVTAKWVRKRSICTAPMWGAFCHETEYAA